MKFYETQNIRNIALVGQAGSGKTTLAESILFTTGSINRCGVVEEHNTVSDYSDLEHERNHSVFNAPLFTEHKNTKINFIDCPGYTDYYGEVIPAFHVIDVAVIVINAQQGIEVGTENTYESASKYNKPVVFAINKLDIEQANFDEVVDALRDSYGNSATVFQFPVKTGAGFNAIVDIIDNCMYEFAADGKVTKGDIPADLADKAEGMRSEFIESIAETDEELMNKYFEEGDLAPEEIKSGLKRAVAERQIFPILCFNSKTNVGTTTFLDFAANYLPAPNEMPAAETIDEKKIGCDANGQASLFIFKMFSDSSLGAMAFFKVMSGTLKVGTDMINEQKSSTERFNQIFYNIGKKRIDVDTMAAGDIGTTVKLKNVSIGNTLHVKGANFQFAEIDFPKPKVRIAIVPQTKGEEEKVGMGLNSICSEDPSYKLEHSQELRQMILFAQGELHLSAAKWRLENRFKVMTDFIAPRVPYRETIQKQVRGSYRHKKQSGGAGQFAEVHMMIEPYVKDAPNPEGLSVRGKDLHELDWGGHLEYVNCIVGGAIDQRFLPAILKGVMEKMEIGPLTGSYVRDIRVVIYDGKMHPVDSNEAAFKMAGRMVFKDNFVTASPKLLEPVYELTIKVPEEFVGDVMSDLPTRRGLIMGIDAEGRWQKVKARMPLAELDKYSTGLRSMTQAKATYDAEFVEYQTVPKEVADKLIEEYQKQQEED